MGLEAYGVIPDGRDVGPGLMKAMAEIKHVVLTKGVYRTSPLDIPSGTVLELEKGAVLKFIPSFELYRPVYTRWEGVECWCMHPCVFINEAEDVTIKGSGRICGSGAPWWEQAAKRKKGTEPETDIEKEFAALNPDYRSMPGGGGGRQVQFLRPPLIQIRKSRNVLIEGVLLTKSPFWTVHPVFSEHVTLKDIRIVNPHMAPNTDGIDIDSSVDVEVSGCDVNVGDDGIAVKSGSGPKGMAENMPSRHIHVHDCKVHYSHGGAAIGSETAAEISDVLFEDCLFNSTDRGIRIKTRRSRGGHVHNLVFRNIEMRNTLAPFVINSYYNCGDSTPSLYSLDKQPVTATTPKIEDVLVENCRATGARASAGMLVGLPESPVLNVRIKDSVFEVRKDANEDVSLTDMYSGLPEPASRGFRIRYAEVTLDNFTVEVEGEPVLFEG